MNRSIITENAPFRRETAAVLEPILASITPEQAAWLDGFLTALRRDGLRAGPSEPLSAPPSTALSVAILFGSESGNAESLAHELERATRTRNFLPQVLDMANATPASLKDIGHLLVLVSTWGEGDPPSPAEDFYKALMAPGAPRLEGLAFSVLALGDTSYARFCQTGKDIDRRLEELGAERIVDRIDCDVDFEPSFKRWESRVLEALDKRSQQLHEKEEFAPGAVAVAPVLPVVETAKGDIPAEFSRRNPFGAKILVNINLNGEGSFTVKPSQKETRHVELSLEGSGLVYEPGDALGVYPTNAPEVADELLRATGFEANATVQLPDAEEEAPLREALLTRYDITGLSRMFLRRYAEHGASDGLNALLSDPKRVEEYLWGREIADAIRDFPIPGLTPTELLALLRKMPPRLYSIASSLKKHPDEVHLTIGTVRYTSHGQERLGVCSTMFAERVTVGDVVPVFVHPNKNFRLPKDPSIPIIMIGPGTGVAPFRAFIEERVAVGANGKSWLVFGEQHYATDFLYQLEWQEYLASGALTHLSVAFSRDQPEKVYVQHKMHEHALRIYDWLENGAHIYICGSASPMGKDVHAALIDIIGRVGGKSREDAEAYVKGLQKAKRYQRDVY